MYESHDLTVGTLKEYYDITETLTATQMLPVLSSESIELCGTTQNAALLCENLSVFETTAEFLKYTRSAQNITRTDFNMDISIINTYINNDSAYVHLYTYVTYYYTGDPEQAAAGDNYVVYFAKLNGEWIIADVYAEEIEANGYSDILTSIDTRTGLFDIWLESDTLLSNDDPIYTVSIEPSNGTEITPQAITTQYDKTYNQANAVAYANTYATANYTAATGNVSSYMNPYFFDFSTLGGNCQNFVSQCIWAGFGGNDAASAISRNQFPMNTSWYCESNGDHSGSFTATSYFRNYINGEGSYSGQSPALIASDYEIDVDGATAFTGFTSSQLLGAVLHVNSTLGHAIIITSATGNTFSGIKFSGNSPMRRARKLTDDNYQLYDMVLIIPEKMMLGRTCGGGGIHTFSGSSCTCTQAGCGFVKLEVIGTMLGPIEVNTSKTISGSANATCYRMAMGITTPSGSTSWYEVTNTNSIYRTYVFSEVGLYTITISGRDISPENENSVSDTHIFKIRVY